MNIVTRTWKGTMSGWKSGRAASKSAAKRLTQPAKTISLASGIDCLFSVSADTFAGLLRSRLHNRLVLPATLISGIRGDGLAIPNSDDSLQGTGKTANGYANELWSIRGIGSGTVLRSFRHYCLVFTLCIHDYCISLCLKGDCARAKRSRYWVGMRTNSLRPIKCVEVRIMEKRRQNCQQRGRLNRRMTR